jgi:hypothetical protein
MSAEITAYRNDNIASYVINGTGLLIWSVTLVKIQKTDEKLFVLTSICVLMIVYQLALIGSCQLS